MIDYRCFGVTSCALYILLIISSCESYLDEKPSSRLNVPTTLADCQALLDDFAKMNQGYPADGQAATDDYYLTESNWNAITSLEDRDTYIWSAEGQHAAITWVNPYRVVYNANLVLDVLERIKSSEREKVIYGHIKGAALFFRAYAHFAIAQLYAAPYSPTTAEDDPGIPIWLSPGLDNVSQRGTVAQTYRHIVRDLQESVSLLPEVVLLPSRPSKTAAQGMLARVYLAMQLYKEAADAAAACLEQIELLDFNGLDTLSSAPFVRFGQEVLFHSTLYPSSHFSSSFMRVDSTLYRSYDEHDLRRLIYFSANGDGSYGFKGNYDGGLSAALFNGLAIDEVFLISAECLARLGQYDAAMEKLNQLLESRWRKGEFQLFAVSNAKEALEIILIERKKELVFRGTRWTDLRRLNQNSDHAQVLRRILGDKSYTLPPNDPRYVFLLPQEVINNSQLAQNPR